MSLEKLSELPPIDIVVISHSHHDHLDVTSVLQLLNSPFPPKYWFCGIGLKRWFVSLDPGFEDITFELDWWQSFKVKIPQQRIIKSEIDSTKALRGEIDTFKITCVPAQHWSGRYYLDKNKSLWCGFCFNGPSGAVYFSGDSGLTAPVFREIGKRFGPFDLAILPTGAYCPRRTHEHVHMDPNDACLIKQMVSASRAVGVHYGTFGNKKFSYRPILAPFIDLANARKTHSIHPSEFFLTFPGFIHTFPTGLYNPKDLELIRSENNDRGIPELVIELLKAADWFDNRKLQGLDNLVKKSPKPLDTVPLTETGVENPENPENVSKSTTMP